MKCLTLGCEATSMFTRQPRPDHSAVRQKCWAAECLQWPPPTTPSTTKVVLESHQHPLQRRCNVKAISSLWFYRAARYVWNNRWGTPSTRYAAVGPVHCTSQLSLFSPRTAIRLLLQVRAHYLWDIQAGFGCSSNYQIYLSPFKD